MEYIQPTKKVILGIPWHYKIDIALALFQIAIEVDGASHCSLERKALDKKKEVVLEIFGWRVLRFKNEEITSNIDACVDKIRATIIGRPCQASELI